MAHDTFLKDWMMAGEAEPEKVVRYLREIQTKYDVFSTFVVSALTDRYYHFNGILKTVSRDSAKDRWFFTMAQHPRGYRVDLDTNEAADDRLTIFVNHKIHDEPESTTLATVRQALIVSLAIGGAITLIVLWISGYTVHRFQTRLERMASIDPLSGLLNRQFAEILFEKALSASRRYGHELSILLFDIDLFKQINDQFGHATGDQVIASVARIAEENRREIDIACRWGRDEFIVLLADCDEASARRIAETLRQRIQDCVRIPQSAQPVTISIGIAAYRPGESLQDLTARADERLYAAKAEGRNRIA